MKMLTLMLVATAACTPMQMKTSLRWTANATEAMTYGSLACDAGSTHVAMGDAKYFETNPVMGSHPSNEVQAVYWTGIASGVAIYNRLLPDALRIVANSLVLAVEYDAISNNTSLGVKPCGI